MNLPDIRVQGAELETDTVALSAEPGLELVPSAKGETRVLPTTELPEAVARQAGRDLVAGFRSLRGPVQVELSVMRRATVATLDAFAKQVWLESNVLPDGRIASRAVLLLQNAGRPVLRIALPKGAEVLALTVDGNNVKAVRDDKGELAVPLGGGANLRVEVRYEQRGSELKFFGRAEVIAPRIDVRQGPLQWRIRVPGDRKQYAVMTDLRQSGGGEHSSPPAAEKDDLVPLPTPFAPEELHFSAAVRDATAEATVVLWLGAQPPVGLGWLLLVVGALLAIRTWRAEPRRMKRLAVLLATAAVGAGIVCLGGGCSDLMEVGEFVVIVVAGGAAVLWAWRRWQNRGRPAPSPTPARAEQAAATVAPPPPPPPAPPSAPPSAPPVAADAAAPAHDSDSAEDPERDSETAQAQADAKTKDEERP